MANKKENILPVADRVLVKREDIPAKKSASGILLPETAEKKQSKYGTVVAVGPGRTNEHGTLIPTSIKPGSKVIFNAGWDNEIDLGEKDEEYFLVKESDILAVLK